MIAHEFRAPNAYHIRLARVDASGLPKDRVVGHYDVTRCLRSAEAV